MPVIYVIYILVVVAAWALAFALDDGYNGDEGIVLAGIVTVVIALAAVLTAAIRSDDANNRRALDRRDAAISQAWDLCRPNRSIAYDVQDENTIVFTCVKNGLNGPLQTLKYYPR